MKTFEKIIYIVIRILIASIALFLAYYLVSNLIKPKVLDELCLTNANNCFYLDIYKYENSFVAQESTTGLWMWYNGSSLYVYGIAPGDCKNPDEFEPVFKIQVDTSSGKPQYISDIIECASRLDTVISYYKTQFKVNKQRIYFKTENNFYTVYDIFNMMFEKKFIA